MVRHLGARALHEPLLTMLEATPTATDQDSEGVVRSARMALRALLPGQPKPVAALTLSPDVTLPLLRALELSGRARYEARGVLAAQVLFSLALASALTQTATLVGPLWLQHSATRRGLRLPKGQRLTLDRHAFLLDGEPLDPWGSTLGALLSDQHGFAVPRDAGLDPAVLAEALSIIASRDPYAESVAAFFMALEVTDPLEGHLPQRPHGLPLAIGRARLPRDASALSLARALLRESAFHKLTVLRLVDPLVRDETKLPVLLRATDAWAGRRLELRQESDGSDSVQALDPHALTPLGQQLWLEVGETLSAR